MKKEKRTAAPIPPPIITACRIGPFPLNVADMRNPRVRVKFDNGKFKELFWFHADDSILFAEEEFIGLTEKQGMALKSRLETKPPFEQDEQTIRTVQRKSYH